MQISFDGIHVKTKEGRILLEDVSGVFLPGIAAILGPSGAGKSLLLSVLAGHMTDLPRKCQASGSIRVNLIPLPEFRYMTLITAFVKQDDVLMGTMTVQEAVEFSAKLRCSREISRIDLQHLTRSTLDLIGLAKASQTIIGSERQKGISGGEKRRTSIAVEIVCNPSVIFLDEPTSGLDAHTQLTVVHRLKWLANHGRIVVTTIHSPSSEMLSMFDMIIILKEGRMVYQGPSNLIPYFSSLGYRFPRFVNPADFVFIEILFRSANEGDAESKDLNLEYLNSHMASRTRALIDNPIFTERIMPQTLKDEPYFALQLGMLIKRATKNLWRDPLLLIIRTFITMILAVFIALVYLNVSSAQGQPVFLNISGAIFFVLINQLFISANSVLHVFITEKSVFLREYVAGYYGLPAYFLSKVIVEFPFQCIFPVLTSVIVYWIIGFRPGFDHFLLFTLFLIMASLNGSAIGFLSSTIVDSPDAAAVIGPLILLPFIIYGGFFVSNKNSPSWLAWIQWISPAQYAFTGMLLNELNGREINGLSGNAQLDLIGASSRFSVGVNIVFLAVLFVVFLAIAYLGLFRIVRKTKLSRSDVRKMKKNLLSMS